MNCAMRTVGSAGSEKRRTEIDCPFYAFYSQKSFFTSVDYRAQFWDKLLGCFRSRHMNVIEIKWMRCVRSMDDKIKRIVNSRNSVNYTRV